MTSLLWFSGYNEPSRKFMACPSNLYCVLLIGSVGGVAHDSGALHLPVAGRVIHHGVVLGATVVPHGHAVGLPAEAHLEFGDGGLADQVLQQLARAGRV